MKTIVWSINFAPATNDGVFGPLIIDGKEEMQLLGLPYRNNAKNLSRLPNGTYALNSHNSPAFGLCYKVWWIDIEGNLVEPDGRTDILIHPGNHVGDIEGCLCPGMNIMRIKQDFNKDDEKTIRKKERLTNQSCCDTLPLDMEAVGKHGIRCVTSSRLAFDRLRKLLGDTEVHKFIIAENMGCETFY